MIDFADNLKKIRLSKGLSQKELAKQSGFSEITIHNYESAKRKPTGEMLIALADFFEISIDELVGRTVVNYDPKQNAAKMVKEYVLYNEEQKLVALYNKASKEDKAIIDFILEKYDDNTKSEKL